MGVASKDLGSFRLSCRNCNQRCRGQIIQTMHARSADKGPASDFYHLSCFVCSVCNISLLKCDGYFTKNHRLFCLTHYQLMYGEKCRGCNDFLTGETVNVMGSSYHAGCLICSSCGCRISRNERVGSTGPGIICNGCCSLFSSEQIPLSISLTCAGCGTSNIPSESTVLALNSSFHPWCFTCCDCDTQIDGVYYIEQSPDVSGAENAICPACYHAKNDRICHGCRDIIDVTNKRIEMGDGRVVFHPDCARCSFCFLWFVDGEKVRFVNDDALSNIPGNRPSSVCFDPISSFSSSDTRIIHEDCSQSRSKIFIEETNLHVHDRYVASYQQFRRMKAVSAPPGVRRSWTFSSTAPSIQAFLPKYGAKLYPHSYLNPRQGNRLSDSLYCRFVSPEATCARSIDCKSKQGDYDARNFHDERRPEVHPIASNGIKIYPKEVLFTANKSIPKGARRTQLELHLSESDFNHIFQMTRSQFYSLPQWKQVTLKKVHDLF